MELNRGRTGAAAAQAGELRDAGPLSKELWWSARSADQLEILGALFGGGDEAAAMRAIERIEKRPRHAAERDACVIAIWEAVRYRSRSTRVPDSPLCDLITRVAATVPVADTNAVAQLDSAMRTGPNVLGGDFGSLVLARAFAARGDTARALRTIRRRAYDWDRGANYLATALRLEGEWAAATGDLRGATSAFQRYLTLRDAPDAALASEVADVRRRLAGETLR
jgi:hypothetical protein